MSDKKVLSLITHHLSLITILEWQREIRVSRSEAEIEPALDRWVTFLKPQPLAILNDEGLHGLKERRRSPYLSALAQSS
jgi:hypothetical protein